MYRTTFAALIGIVILIVCAWFFMRCVDDCTVLRIVREGDTVIEIVDAACKEGLPHTTGPYTVRMTEAAWASARRATTMNHEHVHLVQKQQPAEWAEWYRRYWDYELLLAAPPELPSMHVKALRPNPDTSDAPWALWRHRYLFFPNYTTPRRSLHEAEVLVWDMDQHKLVPPPPAWKSFFCGDGDCPHQYEHPHEIAAEYTAEGSTVPAALKLFAWRA